MRCSSTGDFVFICSPVPGLSPKTETLQPSALSLPDRPATDVFSVDFSIFYISFTTLVCIINGGSPADFDKEAGRTRTAVSSTAQRSHMPKKFPSLPSLLALKVSDGGKSIIPLNSGASVLTFTAAPPWIGNVNTSPSHPTHGGTGSSAVEAVQHGLGFLPREQRGNPAW